MACFATDKFRVIGFAERAQELLDTALAGPGSSEMTVLISYDGGVQLCVDSDWPLDSLLRERGARAAYRIYFREGAIRVEGREEIRTCVLESPRPQIIRTNSLSLRPSLLF